MPLTGIIEHLKKVHPLSATSEVALNATLKKFEVEKNQIFLKEGHVCRYIYFINYGAIRIFYHKHNRVITEWLAFEQEFFFSIKSFYECSPSLLQFQALENTQLVAIPHDAFMQLCHAHHDIETLHRKLLTGSLLLSQERMDSIQFETAQQRYDKLIRTRPNIIQRVPLTYIASFLGIMLETLSRIRNKK